MGKFKYQYFTIAGVVKTAGTIAIEFDVQIDDLLAMHSGDKQWFGEVEVTRL